MLPLNNNYFSRNYTDGYGLDVNLTDSKLAYLEHSAVLTPAEKLHLLMLFMGMQVITDVGLRSDDLQMHQLEIDQLGLPLYRSLTKVTLGSWSAYHSRC